MARPLRIEYEGAFFPIGILENYWVATAYRLQRKYTSHLSGKMEIDSELRKQIETLELNLSTF